MKVEKSKNRIDLILENNITGIIIEMLLRKKIFKNKMHNYLIF